MFESGTTLITYDQEMNDIMKIFKSLIKNGKKLSKITKQKISRNVVEYIKCPFIWKYVSRKKGIKSRQESNQNWSGFLMLPHVLTNFVKMKLNLTVFFSINNLPKINNGA